VKLQNQLPISHCWYASGVLKKEPLLGITRMLYQQIPSSLSANACKYKWTGNITPHASASISYQYGQALFATVNKFHSLTYLLLLFTGWYGTRRPIHCDHY